MELKFLLEISCFLMVGFEMSGASSPPGIPGKSNIACSSHDTSLKKQVDSMVSLTSLLTVHILNNRLYAFNIVALNDCLVNLQVSTKRSEHFANFVKIYLSF